ncbi:MAG: glucose-1-phosphate adenylyltransferase, partial [Mogibacterium sp.]|nr:glucose-1-phosphate adenylyltransferase [Mogibacterium sp.]
PQYIGPDAVVRESILCNGSEVFGTVLHSVVGLDCVVEEGALVRDSVLQPGARIRKGARVYRAIVGETAEVCAGAVFGSDEPDAEIVVSEDSGIIR